MSVENSPSDSVDATDAADAADAADPSGPLYAALREVIDPEIGINTVDLGLVYALHHDGQGVTVDLTMTSPACPLGESIAADVEHELGAVLPEGASVTVNLVWDPPWSPARMSDRAREALGWEI